MVNRYEDTNENLVEVFLGVLEERFPHLGYLKFKLIFDNKKRVKQNKIVLASIELASAKIKFFSQSDIAPEGYDYIIIIDKQTWEIASDDDKRRLISHELRHVFIDEKGNCKIIDHSINDFYEEIKLNQDDPEWSMNLAQLILDIYEQEKDVKKG